MQQNRNYSYFVLCAVIILAGWFPASGQSIYFRPSLTWEDALKLAARENKLVFVDVYTDWCGPCKNMEEQVFSLKSVADYYNLHFLNYKLDAEKGEGVALKEKYAVKVYPTYLFIDPGTGEVVHRSTSRQDPDVFIFTGQSALDPVKRSTWLEQQYRAGIRTPLILKNYADYLSSCYQRELLDTITRKYLEGVSHELTDTLAWYLFNHYQSGSSSKEFSYMLANRELLTGRYGIDEVDKKIRTGYEYDLNRLLMQGIYNKDRFSQAEYEALLARVSGMRFSGKDLMLAQLKVLDLYRQQRYEEAASVADKIPAYPGISEKDILDFYGRLIFLSRNNDDIIWIGRALNYARYIAYNDEVKRAKAEIHYNYAEMLEKYLRLLATSGQKIGTTILKLPEYGKKEYSLRSADLKPKPLKRQAVYVP